MEWSGEPHQCLPYVRVVEWRQDGLGLHNPFWLYSASLFCREHIEQQVLFYTNNNKVYFETRDRNANLKTVRLGYDKKIVIPSEPKVEEYETTIIPIRQEFEDAIVLYGIYQIYLRYGKEIERIQLALNNYKYFVEDMVSTLAHEDDYDREQGTKVLEHM